MTYSTVTVTAMFAVLLAASPSGADPRDVPLMPLPGVSGASTRTLAEFSGRYVILEFIGDMQGAEAERFVRDRTAGLTSLAGTQLVFVASNDAPAVAPRWKPESSASSVAVDDSTRALAREFGLPESGPVRATIMLDKSGREILRQVSADAAAPMPTADLLKRVDQITGAHVRAQYNLPAGKPLAIEGYDPVAYFEQSKAVKGKPEHVARYEGVLYHFSSDANRGLFIMHPEKYTPTYGGWCASAMGAKGTKVEIDPTNFKIKDGRLHLFYKGLFGDALKDWNQHEREWEPAADANWKKIAGEAPRSPNK